MALVPAVYADSLTVTMRCVQPSLSPSNTVTWAARGGSDARVEIYRYVVGSTSGTRIYGPSATLSGSMVDQPPPNPTAKLYYSLVVRNSAGGSFILNQDRQPDGRSIGSYCLY